MNAQTNEIQQAVAEDQVRSEISDEEALGLLEDAAKRRDELLDQLGAQLEGLKDIAIQGRRDAEIRWIEDLRQYHGVNDTRPAKENRQGRQNENDDQHLSTDDNITRSKVLLVAARLGDMLFPTNDANWDLTPSPSPDMPTGSYPTTGPDGAPLTKEQIVEAKKEAAAKAAAAMKAEVNDTLLESEYAAHGRAAIFQASQLGTGVLKGPFTKTRRKTRWGSDGTAAAREITETAAAGVKSVDVWAFYPQPARNMDECEHVFELHMTTPSQLRRLAKQPGFNSRQINRLLDITPSLGTLATGAELERRSVMMRSGVSLLTDGRYPVWEYTGPIPKDALIAFLTDLGMMGGIKVEAMQEIAAILKADNLNQVDAEIWMSQGIVIKAMLRPIRDCDGLGYYVFNYEPDPDDIFGFGVAYLCRDDANAANLVWHAIMLNTMMSSGPQIGVRKGQLEPTQGKGHDLSCTRPKVWVLGDEVGKIEDALSVFNVPNVVGRMMPVYERIKANADEHTMMPMVAQGEPSSAVPTTGGMAMLMNAANVVMRRLAKHWDDNVTIKLLPEIVAWHEQYNPKEEIRGDCCVIPKGASHLLIKDIQAQHIQFATQLFTSNPLLQPYMKPGKWARANIDILELPSNEMLYTDDEVAEAQAKQGEQDNPEVLKAQALARQAEAAMKRAEAEERAKDADIKFKNEDRALDHTERMRELDIRQSTMAMQLQAARFNYLHKLASLDSKERVDMASIAKDLHIAEADQQLKKYGIDFDGQLQAADTVRQENKTAAEIAVESPNPRLA